MASLPVKEGLQKRSNVAWLDALRGQSIDADQAVAEISEYLRAYLGRMLSGRSNMDDVADLAQESLAHIMRGLTSFRGDSAFTTWATGIATRVAFTEMRRRQVREKLSCAFDALSGGGDMELESGTTPPDVEAGNQQLLGALHRAIEKQLSGRQRLAILAELRGIPTIEIAEQLGINQNALYKLTYDARKKLRKALIDAGFTEECIRNQAHGVSR